MAQPALQPTSATNPPAGGQLALQRALDDVWRAARDPKLTGTAYRRLLRRAAELRAQLNTLENSQP